ncbi:MAG: phage major capsid protein [Rhodospirillaceae bacterium]
MSDAIAQLMEIRDAAKAKNESEAKRLTQKYIKGPQKEAFRKRAESRQEKDPGELDRQRQKTRKNGYVGLLDSRDLTRIHKSKAKGDESIKGFHEACDRYVLARAILKRRASESDLTVREYMNSMLHPEERMFFKSLVPQAKSALSKAMDTATSGEGSDWVPPAEMSPSFYDRIDYATEVWGMFQSEQMRGSPVRVGVMGSRPVFYYMGESLDDASALIPATTPGTSNAVLTARKMATRIFVSTEMEEQSFWGAVDRVDRDLPNGAAYYLEQTVINGDTAATTFDTGNSWTSTDARRTFNGLRYHYHSTLGATDGTERVELGAQLAHTDIATVLGYAKQYKNPRSDSFWLTGEVGLREISQMLDVASGTTVWANSAMGAPNSGFALPASGELPSFYGRELVISEHMPENLNDDGIYDNSTTDQSEILLINKSSFVRGTLRGLTVKSEEEIDTDQIKMVATMRVAFAALYGASEPTIVGISEIVQ